MLFRRRTPKPLASLLAFIWPQKGFTRGWLYLMMRILRLRSSDYSLAMGFAIGVGMSFTPFIGFHVLLAMLLAWVMRANFIIAIIGTVVGNPWTFPLIWVLIYSVGTSILGVAPVEADVSMLSFSFFMESPGNVVVSMVVGGVVIGLGVGVVTFGLGYVFAGRIKAKLQDLRDARMHKLKIKRLRHE